MGILDDLPAMITEAARTEPRAFNLQGLKLEAQMIGETLQSLSGVADARHALQFHNSAIIGLLNLEACDLRMALSFIDCRFDDGIYLGGGSIFTLAMTKCRIGAVLAPELKTERTLGFTSCEFKGSVNLDRAEIGGNLLLDGSVLHARSGPGLTAANSRIDGGLFGRSCKMSNAEPEAATLAIENSQIDGDLDLSGAHFSNDLGPVLFAQRARIKGAIRLQQSWMAANSVAHAAVIFSSADAGAVVVRRRVRITNTGGACLNAQNMKVTSNFTIEDKCEIRTSGKDFCLRMAGLQVGGQLRLSDSTVRNRRGSGLLLDGCEISQGLIFILTTISLPSAPDSTPRRICLSLIGGHVSGEMSIKRSYMRSEDGLGILLDGSVLDSSFSISDQTHIDCRSGALTLRSARISRQLRIGAATLSTSAGVTMSADRLRCDSLQIFGDSLLMAFTQRRSATLVLSGARVGGQFSLSDCRILNLSQDGAAVRADRTIFESNVLFTRRGRFSASSSDGVVILWSTEIAGRLEVVDATFINRMGGNVCLALQGARVKGAWLFDIVSLVAKNPYFVAALEGLSYAGTPRETDLMTLSVFYSERVAGNVAQPLQFLANAAAQQGDEEESRAILKMQRKLIHDGSRTEWSLRKRTSQALYRKLMGYGYEPFRALLAFTFVVLLSVAASSTLGTLDGSTRGPTNGNRACSVVENVGIGIENSIPAINYAIRPRCEANPDALSGQILIASSYVTKTAGWILALLYAAGLAGLVRRRG